MEPYRQMAVFAAVAESGSFTAASRKLGIAKSALSRMVTELEQRLGVSLLSRTTRRLSVTEPGAAYYEGCARMVAEASNSTSALEGARAEPRGRLRVTIAMVPRPSRPASPGEDRRREPAPRARLAGG